MRRLLLIPIAALALAATLAAGGSSGPPGGIRYTVELDTGTGLVDGGDFKIAGVRAGVIEQVRLDRRTRHALADVRIDVPEAGAFRTDVRCDVRPQSLLGEYFLDCDPGTAPRPLPPGSRIGVERTTSTIPPDLVTNVLRRPYAERLRLIITSLGAGVAGNGDRLNQAIRRAVPALRETDRVLAVLSREQRALDTLTRDADTVLAALAARKRDVGRFVDETARIATATAQRAPELRRALGATPGFLSELRPTMLALGDLARAGTPALRDTRLSAAEVERTLRALPPVGDGARPALAALGRAARSGRPIIAPTRAQVQLLRSSTKRLPEIFTTLAIMLDHLDDRDNAVENDPRSPGGKGFTGFEGLLRYIVYQGTTINSFDASSHILNAALFSSRCAQYRTPEDLAADPTLAPECAAALGPNQPGVTTPDPTKPTGETRGSDGPRRLERRPAPSRAPDRPGQPVAPPDDSRGPAPAPSPTIDLGGILQGILPEKLLPGLNGATAEVGRTNGTTSTDLLDYLLSP
ncbi:MlaD family protein [Paraconexibacter sp.]|uniref:MlaD family protein n=1 Tax=Paraconexibacter sp. TaxID=2949640 RepID=UPI0035661964